MKLKDPEKWNKFVEANKPTDDDPGYGWAVITYAERWANLIEAAMAKGETLEECADRTSHEANTEGITGYQYGCAVSVLALCWEHGEELRKWHNLKVQIRDEGERANREPSAVLNPALLVIGVKE